MRPVVDLRVDFDDEDWAEGDSWLPDGVLAGYVTLRLRGSLVLDSRPSGLNNSAIPLVRSAMTSHQATDEDHVLDAQWPLFFCAGALPNACGVVADFTVSHEDADVVLRDFVGCEIPRAAEVRVRRQSWARTVEAFGTAVLRRCPATKRGIKPEIMPLYRQYRSDLHAALARLKQPSKRRMSNER